MNVLKYHPLKYRGEVEERVENTRYLIPIVGACVPAPTTIDNQTLLSLVRGEGRGETEDLGPLEIRCMAKNALILMIYTSKNIYSSS